MKVTQIKGDILGVCQFESSDGAVTGVINSCESGVAILEWQSYIKGRTVAALQELKDVYGSVNVINIGMSDEDESWRYWMHMFSKGLVDNLTDDEHFDVTPIIKKA